MADEITSGLESSVGLLEKPANETVGSFQVNLYHPDYFKKLDLGGYKNLGLLDLMRGYDLGPLSEEELFEEAQSEFASGDNERYIFLVFDSEGKAIGSLALATWPETSSYPRAQTFWQSLKTNSPEIVQALKKKHLLAAEVNGIVTLPEFREKGIQGEIGQKALETLPLGIILGNINNPDALFTRLAHFGEKQGFEVFFGSEGLITPGPIRTIHKSVLRAFKETLGEHASENEEIIKTPTDTLKPLSADSVSKLPPAIQATFQEIIREQAKTDDYTITMPLVSIKKTLTAS